jgi:ABC-2 type transport system permease protein
MKTIWTIAKKEYEHYFISPIAYAVGLMIIGILGFIFYNNVVYAISNQSAPPISVVTNPLVTLFLFTTPAITMRLIADELKQGTMETLLTAPVRDSELVIGKWLGALLFSLTVVAMTLIFPIILNKIVDPGIDQGLMVADYLGIILILSALMAIGVFASSLFQNQIAAFFVTIAILLLLWMIGFPASLSTNSNWVSQTLSYMDMSSHYTSFSTGVIQLKDVVYYLSVTVFALFLGTMSVETRRLR